MAVEHDSGATAAGPTRIGNSRSDQLWTYALLGGGGLALFLAAPWLANLLRDVPIVPFKGVLEWVGDLTAWWAWLVRPAVGLVLGLIGALLVVEDEYALEVDDDEVRVLHGSQSDVRRLRRDMIVGVHRDGKKVIVDGTQGRVLFDKRVDASRDRVALAFTSRGYPWEHRAP